MYKFIRKIEAIARKDPKKIVFPEGEEERILQATEKILKLKIAHPILLGNPASIKNKAKKLKLKIDWTKVQIINHRKSKLREEFAEDLYKLRKSKGLKKAEAKELVKDINYFGTMMVQNNHAHGMINGTTVPTETAIRPALQIIGTKRKFYKTSGVFFMGLEDRVLLFADSAITINPNSHDLANIAIDTAETAQMFGIKPKIAMLSFSTKGSAKHPKVDKVKEATAILKYRKPKLVVDGELQVDAAIVPEAAKRKCPNSPIKGDANVLIFPNLESANIAYKLVERLAKAKAIGPILQGLNKPINDLSRGCSYKDIVYVTAFTVVECQNTPRRQ